jgi:hypothetical protein
LRYLRGSRTIGLIVGLGKIEKDDVRVQLRCRVAVYRPCAIMLELRLCPVQRSLTQGFQLPHPFNRVAAPYVVPFRARRRRKIRITLIYRGGEEDLERSPPLRQRSQDSDS